MKGLNLGGIIFVLFALGFCIYGQAVFYPFVHDDVVFIQNNPQIGSLSNLSGIFLKPAFFSESSGVINTYYRPLLEVFYRLEFRLFGLNPAGYHFFNILIHIVNGILVFRLIDLITKRQMLSMFVAAALIVHPVQSQAVVCIAGVSNLLMALFCLASFWFYLKNQRPLALLFFSAGLFTKEQAIILPVLIAVYEICFRPGGEKTWRPALFRIGGFVALVIAYLGLRQILLGPSQASFLSVLEHKAELFLRLSTIAKTVLIYLRLFVAPYDLHYYRSLDVLAPSEIYWVVLLLVCAVIIWVIRHLPQEDRPAARFGIAWFIITLLPTLNILPLIIEYSHIMTAEHFLYLPAIGLFLFFGVALPRFNPVVLIIVFLVWGGMTVHQNTFWRGEIPLFERTLKFEPQLGRVRVLLAKAYYLNGQYEKAVDEFNAALWIMQRYLEKTKATTAANFYRGFIKGIHFDRAHCYEALGQWGRAVADYKEALRLGPNESVIYNNLGSVYLQTGDRTEAMMNFEKAIQLNPGDVMAKNNLAICYIQEGRKEEAARLLKEVLASHPHFPAAKQNLKRLIDSGAGL